MYLSALQTLTLLPARVQFLYNGAKSRRIAYMLLTCTSALLLPCGRVELLAAPEAVSAAWQQLQLDRMLPNLMLLLLLGALLLMMLLLLSAQVELLAGPEAVTAAWQQLPYPHITCSQSHRTCTAAAVYAGRAAGSA